MERPCYEELRHEMEKEMEEMFTEEQIREAARKHCDGIKDRKEYFTTIIMGNLSSIIELLKGE